MAGAALILGAGSGIGAAAARQLAADGNTIAVADLSMERASVVASELGQGHVALQVDVGDESSLIRCFDEAEAALGPLRVAVVTAGVPGLVDGARRSFRDTTVESWNEVFDINARGTFLVIREMLRRRQAAPVPHARVVTISSITAQMIPRNTVVTYAASKGTVLVLTRVGAVEAEALGMTVNAVAPGVIDTPMLRSAFTGDEAFQDATSILSHMGQPEDIGAAISFLASDKAAFINGACIDVNGGVVMR